MLTRMQRLFVWTMFLLQLALVIMWAISEAWVFALCPGLVAFTLWGFTLVRDWRWRRDVQLNFAAIKIHTDGLFKRDVQ